MFNKLFLATAVAAAGMFVAGSQASAGHGCYSGVHVSHYSHVPHISRHSYSPYYASPYRSYRVPSHSYFGPGYGHFSHPSYFGGYGGRSYYGGHRYFGGGHGYFGSRHGVSVGFGY